MVVGRLFSNAAAGRASPDHILLGLRRRFSGLDLQRMSQEHCQEKAKLSPKQKMRPHDLRNKSSGGAFKPPYTAGGVKHQSTRSYGREYLVASEYGMMSCFKETYRGDGAQRLKSALETRLAQFEKAGPGAFHAKFVALANSLFMGKSRTVLELGRHHVFVFYCSLAPLTSSTYTFPPRTGSLALELAATVSTEKMTLYMLAWLDVLLEFIEKEKAKPGGGAADMALEWVQRQECVRDPEPVRRQVSKRWQRLVYIDGLTELSSQKLRGILREKIEAVLEKLGHVPDGKQLKLLFVVDEAKHLLDRQSFRDDDSVPYLHLLRAAEELGPATLLLLVDTSKEIVGHGGSLHPVCVSGSMDLMLDVKDPTADEGLVPGMVKKWLEDPARWTQYGRAVWSLLFRRVGIWDVLNVAQYKLLSISKPNYDEYTGTLKCLVYPSELSLQQAIALLAFTVGVEVPPNHELARDLSASNMIPMVLISDDRLLFWPVAPIEPAVSAAAAKFLLDPVMLKRSIEQWCESLKDGKTVMKGGQRAELVASFYVTMAMLECQAAAVEYWRDDKYLLCVPTLEFMKRLVGEFEIPAEHRRAFEKSFVFFNRILRLDRVPSRPEAVEFFKRGVICYIASGDNDGSAAIYIFIWFPSKEPESGAERLPPFSVDNMTYCVISVNHQRSAVKDMDRLKDIEEEIFVSDDLPYFVIEHAIFGSDEVYASRFSGEDERMCGIMLSGLRGPLSEGRFKSCIGPLQRMLTVQPWTDNPEVGECYRHVNPWTYGELLPKRRLKPESDQFTNYITD